MMYKPSERIEFLPAPGQWPTAEEAGRSQLFAPISIGPTSIKTRTWIPAMVPWRATPEGMVSQEVIDWYVRFAEGRPGAIVIEATGIRDVPSGPLLRIGHDRYIPGLKSLVDAVREASGGETRLLIQIIDFLSIKRRPDRNSFLERFLVIDDRLREATGVVADEDVRQALVAMPDEQLFETLSPRDVESLTMGYRERVTDIDLPHIAELPQVLPSLFSEAAKRAEAAGFDGVELHYAHAYTMASFLSAKNTREDGYGGARENRVKLPLEVYRAVREKVSPNFAVGCRFLADECIEGGNSVEDAVYFGVEFAKAGMDFLSLSRGGKFDDAMQPKVKEAAYPYTGPSGYECMPHHISDAFGFAGRNLAAAKAVRTAIREAGCDTPVVNAGGVHGFEMAEAMLADGHADIVASARQSLADPDWFLKMRKGRGSEVRVCEFSNYCEGLDQKHKVVTCQLWDRVELEPGARGMSANGKRRLIAPDWR